MDEISSNQIESQLHFSKIGIPSSTIINADDYYKKMYDYSELIKMGSNLVLINNYFGALKPYNMALSLAYELNDDYKINETLCYIGIVYFYLGQLNESIKKIQPCYNYINSVCRSKIGTNTIRNLYLLCKSGANLSIILTTTNYFGGENKELSYSFAGFGLLCIIFGIIFIVAFKCNNKKDK